MKRKTADKETARDTARDTADLISIESLADEWQRHGLKLTARRYRQIAREGLVTSTENGKVSRGHALVSLILYFQKMAQGRGDSTHEEIKKQRDLEKLEMDRMERKRMEESLIDRAEVAGELVKRVHVLKSDLLAIEKRLVRWPEARDLVAKQVRHLMKTYSRKAGVFKE